MVLDGRGDVGGREGVEKDVESFSSMYERMMSMMSTRVKLPLNDCRLCGWAMERSGWLATNFVEEREERKKN